MPLVNHNGVRIHYECEGVGPPLLLYHGFRGSLMRWQDAGYTRRLSARFQLVLIDARGHGRSDLPAEPDAYSLNNIVGDVEAVLDDLGIEQTHFLGYSMGGRAGLAFAARRPDRLLRLAAGGTYMFAPKTALRESARREIERVSVPESDADAAYLAWLERQLVEPGLEGRLRDCAVPMLMYCGSDDDDHLDPARRSAALIPNAQFAELPGLDHTTTFECVSVVTQLCVEFFAAGD